MKSILVLLSVSLISLQRAEACGLRGQTVANLAAVEGIPQNGPIFLKAQEAYIGLQISSDASSINLRPVQSIGTVSTIAPQELHLRSATSPCLITMRQPSQSAPVATS